MADKALELLLEAQKDIVALQRELSIRLSAHSQILFALLHIIDPSQLQQLKRIVAARAEGSEPQGHEGEACRLAANLVSLMNDGGGTADPRTMFQLIPGGKKDSSFSNPFESADNKEPQ